jgi:hypothetical protein
LHYVIFAADMTLMNFTPQDVSGIAPPPESEDITETLRSQIKSVMDRIGHGDEYDRKVQQAQEEKVG